MEYGSIRSELLKYFSYSPETATSSAFVQQRDKLKPDTFRSLFYSFSDLYTSKTKDGYQPIPSNNTVISKKRATSN